MFPPKYRRGGPSCFQEAIIAAVCGHPSLLFEEGLSHGFLPLPAETVTVNRLKPSFSGAHTHTQTHTFAQDTHRCRNATNKIEKQQILCHRIAEIQRGLQTGHAKYFKIK